MAEFATIEKVSEGFKAAKTRMDGVESEAQAAYEDIKKEVDAILRRLRVYGQSILAASDRSGSYEGFWPSDVEAKQFGEIVFALARGDKSALLEMDKTKAMGTTTNPLGGYLVPTELSSWIIQKLGVYGKFRRNSQVVQLGGGKQNVPRITTDLTIYCPDEGGEITKSDVKVDMIGLIAKKFCCLTAVNRELEEDSLVGLGEIVGASIVRSMAKKEDEIGFVGDGTEPYFGMRGIVGSLLAVDAVIANIKGLIVASGNAYSEITLGDFRKVVGMLPSDADDGAKWYMHKKFYYEVVYPLAEAAGVANIFEILSPIKGRFLLGYPVEFVQSMPHTEANSQICAILGDLKVGAFIGERRALEIARSDEVLFGNDQVAIRGTERIDINAYGVGDTTDAGPIVAMITAAS